MRAPALLGILLLVPLTHAHGDPAPYDPLVLEWHTFLAIDGGLVEAAPTPGAIAFPASAPPASPAPLVFSFDAPVRFAPAGGFELTLSVRVDAPVVSGGGIEAVIAPGGTPKTLELGPALAPGSAYELQATLSAGAEYAEGDALTLILRPLAPTLAEGALSVVVGGDAPSRLDVREMRVPAVADLGLNGPGVVEFLLGAETFRPSKAGAVVNEYVVSHERVVRPASERTSPNGTYVVLRGEEQEASALGHAFVDRERRLAAAHAFAVGGAVVRVHPGIGVAIAANVPVTVSCIASCPPAGFVHVFASDLAPSPADRPSSLVPPPRDTSGIPVSQDAETPRDTPLPGWGLVAGLAVAACRRRRRA